MILYNEGMIDSCRRKVKVHFWGGLKDRCVNQKKKKREIAYVLQETGQMRRWEPSLQSGRCKASGFGTKRRDMYVEVGWDDATREPHRAINGPKPGAMMSSAQA